MTSISLILAVVACTKYMEHSSVGQRHRAGELKGFFPVHTGYLKTVQQDGKISQQFHKFRAVASSH